MALFFFISSQTVHALPQSWTVENGDVSFDTSNPNELLITASDQAIINFESFSIGVNEAVRFVQPNADASTLARVTGSLSSDIYGFLGATGQLVFINSNGITFHETASIQAASLIASTLDIQDAAFLAGQYTFEKNHSDLSQIINEASITASDGGHIALLADRIENHGTLTAYAGNVVLGSAQRATLSFDPGGYINLVLDEPVAQAIQADAGILNAGEIHANGGQIQISARTFDDTLNALVNNTGLAEATHAVDRDGRIEFISNGAVLNSGTIRTETFIEQGYTFRTTGTLEGGDAYYDNLDGAAFISGNIGSNQTDVGDIVINGDITLTNWVSFIADSDQNGTGAILWTDTVNDSITGANMQLALRASDPSTLGPMSGLSRLTLLESQNGSDVSWTANANISSYELNHFDGTLNMGGYGLTLTAAYSLSGGNFLGGNANHSIGGLNLGGGTFTSTSGNFTITGVGGLGDLRGGAFDPNGGTVIFAGGADIYTNDETFHNVQFVKSSAGASQMAFHGDMTLTGDLTFENSSADAFTLTPGNASYDVNIGGDLVINSNAAAGAINIYGAYASSNVNYNLTGANSSFEMLDADATFGQASTDKTQLTFSGAGTQNFTTSAGTYYGDFIVNKASGSVILNSDLTIAGNAGDVVLTSGTFDWNDHNVSVANEFTWEDAANMINTTGDFQVGTGASGGQYAQNDTTGFTAASGQDLDFYAMEINGGDFDASAATGFDVSNWTTMNSAGTLTMPNVAVSLGGLAIYDGTVIATSGNLTIDGSAAVELAGGGNFDHNSGTIIFDTTTNAVAFFGDGSVLNNVQVIKSNGGVPWDTAWWVDGDFTIEGDLAISNAGSDALRIATGLAAGGSTISILGNINIANDAAAGDILLYGGTDIDGDPVPLTFNLAGATSSITVSDDDTSFGQAGSDATTLLFSGTGTQALTVSVGSFLDSIVVNKASGEARLGANLSHGDGTDDNLTISNGAFDLNGYNLIYANPLSTFSNDDIFRLQGGETITNVTMDTNSGLVEYDGAGTYASLAAGDDYYDVTFSGAGDWTAAAATDVNRHFTLSNGTFTAPSSTLTVSGNFDASGGVFAHNSGDVIFNDASQTTILNAPAGGLTFWDLTMTTAGKTFSFTAGDTFNVASPTTWTVAGTVGNPIVLQSTSLGDAWFINPAGFDVSYVTVSDSINQASQAINPMDSLNGGGSVNWWSFPSGTTAPLIPAPSCQTAGSCRDQELGNSDLINDDLSPAGGDEEGDMEPESYLGNSESRKTYVDTCDPFHPDYRKERCDTRKNKAKRSDIYVREGAVDVNGHMVYDGEAISVYGKEGRSILSMRALYIAGGDGIDVIRARIHEPIMKFKMTDGPTALNVSGDGKEVYSASTKKGRITAIRTPILAERTLKETVGHSVDQILRTADGQILYLLSQETDSIYVMNAETGNLITEMSLSARPGRIALSKDESKIFSTSRVTRAVTVWDAQTGEALDEISFTATPYGISAWPANQDIVWITFEDTNQAVAFDVRKHQEVAVVPTGKSPQELLVDSSGSRVYVANRESNDVSVIEISNGISGAKEIARIPVGLKPSSLALTPEEDKLYVANTLSGNLSLLDVQKFAPLATIPAGTAPQDVVISSPAQPKVK